MDGIKENEIKSTLHFQKINNKILHCMTQSLIFHLRLWFDIALIHLTCHTSKS